MGRLIKLINELAGGKVVGPTTDIYPKPIENKEISIKKSYITIVRKRLRRKRN